uniref:Uncharacterized protein n=1 Tax=Arundo donax TaxID=35708 RepID=A0A0A9D698_ARUDO
MSLHIISIVYIIFCISIVHIAVCRYYWVTHKDQESRN